MTRCATWPRVFSTTRPTGSGAEPTTLKAIYDSSLIVLYRLLFILYAEARGLLPVVDNPAYRASYSLHAIKHAVAAALDASRRLLPTSATLWPALATLFEIIDKGSPPLAVATFDGGLFDPARHPFLEQYAVGDAHLQQAVDRLTRVDGQFVDYRDLAERHLGTIYEGLLEYHLEAIPPEGTWTVALLNDRGERKATGSYYTPDYIVKYIVDQTVGPVLRAAVAGLEDDAQRVAAVLRLNILDMSMGSGHFPVEATEYIARFLVDLAVAPDAADAHDEPDLQYWKRRVAQSCIYGVDLNPLAVELAKLSLWLVTAAKDRPLSFLDHHLRTGNALVGARIADLQVGGGAQPRTRRRAQPAAGQLSMLDDEGFRQSMSIAVDSMWLIEGSAGNTVDEVKEQERIYAALRDTMNRRYGRLADLATATHFGLTIDAAMWQPLADHATGRTMAALPRLGEWLAEADALAEQHHFFHWELEFPEVYFDRHGQPLGEAAGFDAVVGNPPYVRQEQMGRLKPYLQMAYPRVYHGTADLFVYFFGQGLQQLRQGGRLAYISSNSWLRANYAGPLRSFLRTEGTVETLIDLGDNRVFADAPDVYPAIQVVRREAPPADHSAQVAVFTRGEGLAGFADRVAAKLAPVSIHDQADSGWQLGADVGRRVFAKLMAGGRPLGEVVNGRMYYGIKTGLNEAFIVDQVTRGALVRADPACAAIIKPILRGEDLRPWYQEDEGRWLIVLPSGWTRGTLGVFASEEAAWNAFHAWHPAVAEHLRPFAEAARKRQDKGQYWWELRACDYYDAFEQPKIFWPDIAKLPRFSLGDAGQYVGNTGYFVKTSEPWLLGYLMSRCCWFVISYTAAPLGERAGSNRYRLFDQYLRPIPVPDAPTVERETIGALAKAITEQARERYELHRRTRRRILSDLGVPGKGLNQKLTAWWDLPFSGLRAELQKVFRRDIPVKERDDWSEWLADRQQAHRARTAEIVRLETELNARVYALFDFTAGEIRTIEDSTRYRYGEV